MSKSKPAPVATGAPVESLLPTLDPEAEAPADADAARAALEAPGSPEPAPAGPEAPPPAPNAPEEPVARRKGGRPRGSKTREDGEARGGESKAALRDRIRELEATQPSNTTVVQQSLEGTFGFLAMMAERIWGPDARVEKGDVKLLAETWTVPLAPHISAETGKYLPWITAAGITYAVLAPRYEAIKARKLLEAGEGIVETGEVPASVPSADAVIVEETREPEPLP